MHPLVIVNFTVIMNIWYGMFLYLMHATCRIFNVSNGVLYYYLQMVHDTWSNIVIAILDNYITKLGISSVCVICVIKMRNFSNNMVFMCS